MLKFLEVDLAGSDRCFWSVHRILSTQIFPLYYFLVVIGITVLYESYLLVKGSRTIEEENIKKNEIVENQIRGGKNLNR